MKLRAGASSTVIAILLATSTYGVRLDTAINRLVDAVIGAPHEQAATAPPAPITPDYEARLAPADLAVDSPFAGTKTGEAGNPASRLTLIVGDGQTLAGVLASADVTPADAQAAVEAMRKVYDPRKLRPGQSVTVDYQAGQDGAFQGFAMQADPEHQVLVTRGAAGFQAEQTKLAVRTETRAQRGVIHNSLIEATSAAGVPYPVTAAMIRAFSFDVDFQRDIQPGDRFKVMYNTSVTEGGASRAGEVQYAELVLSGKSHAIYGVRRDDGTVDYFTRDGKSIKQGLLKTPVDGARLTSGFGMRMHPILGFTRMHKGVDFGVPTGTPIYAAGDGTIEFSGWAGGYGRFIKIRHNPRMETAYGHMSRLAATVGEHVHQGEVIGYVGMTGDATGPHLHYEVIKDGSQVNPISVTIPVDTGLDGSALVAFLKTVDEREERFAAIADGGLQYASAPTR